MNLLFRRRSDLDDLLKPQRRFHGLGIGILLFALVIALLWYFFFELGPDAPPPAAVAPAPAAVPAPAPVPEPAPEPTPVPQPTVAPAPQKSPPKPTPIPQKAAPAAKPSNSPAPARQSDKPDSDADN